MMAGGCRRTARVRRRGHGARRARGSVSVLAPACGGERCEHAHGRRQRHVSGPSSTWPAASEGTSRAAAAPRRDEQRGSDDGDELPGEAQRRRFQRWVARSAANFSRSEIARRATIFRRRSIYSSATDFSALGANETDRFTIENFCAKTSSEKPTQIAKHPTPTQLGTCTCFLF